MKSTEEDMKGPERICGIRNLERIEDFVPVPKGGKGKKAASKAKAMRVISAWERVAPSNVLDHSDNVYLFEEGGKTRLVVYVDSGVWAAELGTQKHKIRQLMERQTGQEIDSVDVYPSSIGFKKKSVRFSKEHIAQVERVKSVPLTGEERSRAEAGLEEIESDRLKEALLRARTKDMEWKKGLMTSKRL